MRATDTHETEIEHRTQDYEAQLRAEIELLPAKPQHWTRPRELPFTKDQIPNTTILFGGLTIAHEELIAAAMEGVGYKIERLPVPDNESLTVGKELGSRGQCNPTYYTVGNLVKYLKGLRDAGERDIEDRYVFVTAGGCGPCRFGMYEAEFRKALRDAGFDNFRVLLFEQRGGLSDGGAADNGLQITFGSGTALLKAMILGDLLNDVGYKIRPYEVHPGETDRVIEEARAALADALREKKSVYRALRRIKKRFDAVEADYTRVKPKVKITGEFWAQTTEGDGNYHMFRWLESEGAEVLVEPIGTWIEYLIWISRQDAEERAQAAGTRGRYWKYRLLRTAFRSSYNLYRPRSA